jgi:hypothetical protein
MTLHEIIDSLIDVTGVPLLKQQGKKYEDARKEIHDNLTTIEDVTAACYHEAGHLIYANLVGFKYNVNTTDFKILGPRIKYVEENGVDCYDATPTAIDCPGLHTKIPETNDGLFDTATISIAGGESVSHFSKKKNKPMWKRGDYDDRDRFQRFATNIYMRVGRPINPYMTHWRDAAVKVLVDFASETYTSDIETEALYAMMHVFRPVFLNTSDSQ